MTTALVGNDTLVLSPTFTDVNENPTAADSTPVATVVNTAGTTLAAPVVASQDVGVYGAALLAASHTAVVDNLTVTWAGAVDGLARKFTTTVPVVGAHYFTIPELRQLRDLSDTSRFPTSLLVELREEYEEYLGEIIGTSFVPMAVRDAMDGGGRTRLNLSRQAATELVAVTINGQSQDVAGFTLYRWGQIEWPAGGPFPPPTRSSGGNNVVVDYVAGWLAPPAAVKREVMKAIRHEALATLSDDGAAVISQTFDGLTLRYSTPDPAKGRPTGILTLDPVLVQYDETTAIA